MAGAGKKKRGPSGFQPEDWQRDAVTAMIAAGISTDVARQLIINPDTGKPIARSNFWRTFKSEIQFGGKSVTGKAAATLVQAMGDRTKSGQVTNAALRAAEFWLARREGDLFSERRINENIEKRAVDELGKISGEEAERIADNVLKAAKQNRKARAGRRPTIDDDPAGNA